MLALFGNRCFIRFRPSRSFLAVFFLFSPAVCAQEEEAEEPPSPVKISHDAAGSPVLEVDEQTQSRIMLTTAKLAEESLRPEIVAYGVLLEDPGRSFTLRSPLSGYLRAQDGVDWPSVGEAVAAGTILAAVEPRLTPTESLDLLTRWMEARGEVDELAAEIEAARSSFEHKRGLNQSGKLVSDRSVEEAEVKLRGSEARWQAVKERLEALEQAMPHAGAAPHKPLNLESGGEVVEVGARPGEEVETGQVLLRLADFDVLLARVTVPPGSAAPTPLPAARLSPVGKDGAILPAEPLGRAPSADSAIPGDTLLFRVRPDGVHGLRPGMPIVAHIPQSAEPVSGTVVPRSALLRYAGLDWVYVALSGTEFSRRQVVLQSPLVSGWFVSTGVLPGESVVTGGAQSLLSEEMKAEIESEEEAEE